MLRGKDFWIGAALSGVLVYFLTRNGRRCARCASAGVADTSVIYPSLYVPPFGGTSINVQSAPPPPPPPKPKPLPINTTPPPTELPPPLTANFVGFTGWGQVK